MLFERVRFLPKGREGDGLLPLVIAVMVFMTALALVGALAIGEGVSRWSVTLEGQLTVQIVTDDDAARGRDTAAALRLLRATPGVASAEVLADSEVMALIAPWLGRIPTDSGLPLPNLIDVRVRPGAALNTAAVAERLRVAAPSATLDDHEDWLGQILNLAHMLRLVLGACVLLVALSTAAIVVFGCRASLAAHRNTIEIMHLLGTEDSMIAASFNRKYFIHGLQGGILGMVVAGLVLWGLARLAAELGDGLILALMPQGDSYLWLLTLPLGIATLTALTAYMTVRRVLLAMV